jgi:hypothetical protein
MKSQPDTNRSIGSRMNATFWNLSLFGFFLETTLLQSFVNAPRKVSIESNFSKAIWSPDSAIVRRQLTKRSTEWPFFRIRQTDFLIDEKWVRNVIRFLLKFVTFVESVVRYSFLKKLRLLSATPNCGRIRSQTWARMSVGGGVIYPFWVLITQRHARQGVLCFCAIRAQEKIYHLSITPPRLIHAHVCPRPPSTSMGAITVIHLKRILFSQNKPFVHFSVESQSAAPHWSLQIPSPTHFSLSWQAPEPHPWSATRTGTNAA